MALAKQFFYGYMYEIFILGQKEKNYTWRLHWCDANAATTAILHLSYSVKPLWSHCGATIASVCVGCVLGVDLDFKEAVIRQNALGGGIGNAC